MINADNELKSTLTGQNIGEIKNHELLLQEALAHAGSYAKITEGIAVLSDFSKKKCHTFSGKFGREVFSLAEYTVEESSPFEEKIFNGILKEDLIERHILELRFFNFIRNIPAGHKTDYQMSCIIRFCTPDGATLPVLHTSRYIQWDRNESVWLGFCTYIPLPSVNVMYARGIVSSITGETVRMEKYIENDRQLLSKRQIEILSMLAKGDGSKQIADKLNISVHTVNRHRQDILSALKVNNSSSAVEIAMRLNLI